MTEHTYAGKIAPVGTGSAAGLGLDRITAWDWYAGQALVGFVLVAEGETQIARRAALAAKYADEMMRQRQARIGVLQ